MVVVWSAAFSTTCTSRKPLTVISISPASGTTSGGTVTAISGTGFRQGATAALGGKNCGAITIVSSTEISCTTAGYSPSTVDSTVDVVVTNPDNQSVTLTGGFKYAAPEISAWTDVSGSNGALNRNLTYLAGAPKPAVLDSKLYVTWDERKGPNATDPKQIRVAEYGGDDANPSWTFVDGGGVNGLNRDPARFGYQPQLAALNSKLYVIWEEDLVGAISGKIRVSVYNGDGTWTAVDGTAGAINKYDTQEWAQLPRLTVSNSKLYAAWMEYNGTVDQIHVSVFDGTNTWTLVDGAAGTLNNDPTKSAAHAKLAVVDSKLYVSWREFGPSDIRQIRVAAYNGNDDSPGWTFLDGGGTTGINKNPTNDHAAHSEGAGFNSKLYLTWQEPFGELSKIGQIRVAVFNGSEDSPAWTFVDGSAGTLNWDSARFADWPKLEAFNSKLYASFVQETDAARAGHVAVYNGDDSAPSWSFVDGGTSNGIKINPDQWAQALPPWLTVFNNKLYTAWSEENAGSDPTTGLIRVAVGR